MYMIERFIFSRSKLCRKTNPRDNEGIIMTRFFSKKKLQFLSKILVRTIMRDPVHIAKTML